MSEAKSSLQPVFLAAGGTGGHLFPAQALAEELERRGRDVILLTDPRGKNYDGKFPAKEIIQIASATLSPRRPIAAMKGSIKLLSGVLTSKKLIEDHQPAAIIGFGGYPSLPPLLAGKWCGTTLILHEQNAVLGRANHFAARWCHALATSFRRVEKIPVAAAEKTHYVGNPVRGRVMDFEKADYKKPGPKAQFRLLVFGGSQGAKIFTDLVPKAIRELPRHLREKIRITQQVHKRDVTRVKKFYDKIGVKAECAPFFENMPSLIAKSHLVLSRSGASTIAELSLIGRPAILVPLPGAVDQDQAKNAAHFCRSGAGWLMPQNEMTSSKLAALLTQLRYSDDQLTKAAVAAGQLGRPHAARDLCDLVLETIEKQEKEQDPR